jgi:hypothetical protein
MATKSELEKQVSNLQGQIKALKQAASTGPDRVRITQSVIRAYETNKEDSEYELTVEEAQRRGIPERYWIVD